MSQYTFIASDYELPQVTNPNIEIITVREAIMRGIEPNELMPWEEMDQDAEVLVVEDEEYLYELEIMKEDELYDDVGSYTEKPYIYSVDFHYTEKRGNELLKYLKSNIRKGHTLELWTIWLNDKTNVQPKVKNFDEISLDDIDKMFNSDNENWENHSVIIIKG
ncbi:MAG TPA: hypothetical protein DGK91_11370 [Clostridium sp.]|jgi:hypothetical protein|nr:hypothetical protein [Clostridium sp.]